MSTGFRHDSFWGFLNLLKVKGIKTALDAGDRPPYPVIHGDPDALDVLDNLNIADFGALTMFTAVGIPLSYWASTARALNDVSFRRGSFKLNLLMFFFFGASMALYNSTARLAGLTENGLRWRYNLTPLRKYDFTSEYEKGTIWRYFR